MIYVTRKEHFSSSHTLNNTVLSADKNEKLFGKCNNFHGHNYNMEVTVCGEPDKLSGYVIDLKLLKNIIQEEIIDKVDHKFLNDLEMFKGIIPTTENLVVKFWGILENKIKQENSRLYSIKLFETEKNCVYYKG